LGEGKRKRGLQGGQDQRRKKGEKGTGVSLNSDRIISKCTAFEKKKGENRTQNSFQQETEPNLSNEGKMNEAKKKKKKGGRKMDHTNWEMVREKSRRRD